jgi:hypothetical protein
MTEAVQPSMLVGITSLALVFLAVHTKWIYTNAMEEMFAEQPRSPRHGGREAPRGRSHSRP